MFLITAFALFAVFVANVVIGASGGARFLGDVGEMLLLFAASLAFVVAILQRETAARTKENNQQTNE